MIFYIKCIKVQTLKYLQDVHVLNTFNVKVIGVLHILSICISNVPIIILKVFLIQNYTEITLSLF